MMPYMRLIIENKIENRTIGKFVCNDPLNSSFDQIMHLLITLFWKSAIIYIA